MSQPDFFNTVELRGGDLKDAREQARHQERKILAYFRRRRGVAMTPEDVMAALPPGTPLTSARRAITNLTTKGYLLKVPLSEIFRRGKFGKPVHSWRLFDDTQQETKP